MSEQPGSLAEALIALQASLPRITKDDEAQVGTRTYRYANLASIHDAVFPLLAECGLCWICEPTLDGDRFVLLYVLEHAASSERLKGRYPLPESGSPQQIGSAITYARRYCLTAVLGIAPAEDDDDGQAASDTPVDWRPPANPRTRKAERSHSPDPHDPWASQPEQAPRSSTPEQHRRLGILFGKVAPGGSREDRLAMAMSLLDLPELETSKALSFAEAETLARKLEDLAKEGSGNGDV